MGILGIYASSVLKVTNSYESIATVTVGSGGSTQIDFTSIPSTFKHLQLRALVKGSTNLYSPIRFNGDSPTTNYKIHELYGSGAGTPSSAADSNAYLNNILGTNYNAVVMDILDYTSTTKNKTVRMLNGIDNNGTGSMIFASILWMNSSNAISSIRFTVNTGNFAQYSQFALYGIKG
jgi:hypothetical protein